MPQENDNAEQVENRDITSIHIAIDSRGNILLETVGATGNQCDLLAGALEKRLGKVEARKNKDCYDQAQK